MKALVIPVPSIEEQSRIIATIAARAGGRAVATNLLGRQLALLRERRQALITAAVTGQLDIPDAV